MGLVGLSALVAPAGAAADAVSTLRATGKVTCRPSLPNFCHNMHVACSGKTSVQTFSFTLRASAAGASLQGPPGARAVLEPYRSGTIEWAPASEYVIIRPGAANGYVKLLSNGNYIFRHYLQHEGVMSLGTCA